MFSAAGLRRLPASICTLFFGLRLLAAYCHPYGSAAVLLPLRNTHVLACYVLGSRLAPATCEHTHAFFLGGLRLLAAYCPQYGSAAVLLPIGNTHVLACYVLGSRLAPTTCEHTHAFFGATPQCALPILVLAHKAPPKPKNAAFRDAARRWRTKLSQKQKMRHLTGGSEMPLGLR